MLIDPTENSEQETSVRRQLSIGEVCGIVSLVSTIVTGGYVAGKLTGDVQRNTERIQAMEPRLDAVSTRIERIDANVTFLTDEAKERRNGR